MAGFSAVLLALGKWMGDYLAPIATFTAARWLSSRGFRQALATPETHAPLAVEIIKDNKGDRRTLVCQGPVFGLSAKSTLMKGKPRR